MKYHATTVTAQTALAPRTYGMPETASSSHALRPDTTAERATMKRCIFPPPTKNSRTPAEEKRAAYTPIVSTSTT